MRFEGWALFSVRGLTCSVDCAHGRIREGWLVPTRPAVTRAPLSMRPTASLFSSQATASHWCPHIAPPGALSLPLPGATMTGTRMSSRPPSAAATRAPPPGDCGGASWGFPAQLVFQPSLFLVKPCAAKGARLAGRAKGRIWCTVRAGQTATHLAMLR